MQKILSYQYLGKTYQVILTHKSMRQKNIHFRLKDDIFYISAPYTVSNRYIMKVLEEKYGPLLIQKEKPKPEGDNFIYLFGQKCDYPEQGRFSFSDGSVIEYKTKEEFVKKMRKVFLKMLTEKVRYYEKIMGLPAHNVKVRNMSSRYGSNSKKTKSVTFALNLYHYSFAIIDAIIVHELAHSFYFDHSDNFYRVVYKYCPDYKNLHNKLRKGEYQ